MSIRCEGLSEENSKFFTSSLIYLGRCLDHVDDRTLDTHRKTCSSPFLHTYNSGTSRDCDTHTYGGNHIFDRFRSLREQGQNSNELAVQRQQAAYEMPRLKQLSCTVKLPGKWLAYCWLMWLTPQRLRGGFEGARH